MEGPMLVVFCGMYMYKMKNGVKRFEIRYIRHEDDTYRKRDETEKFFNALNIYHPNIKLTVEEKTTKLLETKIARANGEIKMQSILEKDKISRPIVIQSVIPLFKQYL